MLTTAGAADFTTGAKLSATWPDCGTARATSVVSIGGICAATWPVSDSWAMPTASPTPAAAPKSTPPANFSLSTMRANILFIMPRLLREV